MNEIELIWTNNLLLIFKMFSVLYLFLALSLSASGRVIPITKSSFKRFIEKRPKDEIWIVMFHTDSNFQSKKLYPKFLNASTLASGMFRFGVVDTKQQPLLTRDFMLRSQPSFIVFHQKGQTEYDGDGDPDDLIEFASQYLNDNTIEINESFTLPSAETKSKPVAILFTKKKTIPNLWKGISHVFKKKRNVIIGICQDEKLFLKFGIKDLPSIVFINSTYNYTYTKKLQFAKLERTLEKFLSKNLKIEKDDIPDVILPSDDFSFECIGRLKICIIDTKKGEDPSFEEMHRVYSTMQFKWFKGISGIPFDFIKENEIWIYNPKVDGFIKVNSIVSMGGILEKVYESSVEWTRKNDLVNKNVEL